MSTTPVTRLYDAATIHEDSNESAALEYLAALGEPTVELTIDGQTKKYHSRKDIFRAMLSIEGGHEEPPALMLGSRSAPELILARLAPYDVKFLNQGCCPQMWYSLSNEDENLGNVCQENKFTLDSLFEATTLDGYEGHYRIAEYAEVSCGEVAHADGTTSAGRLPDGSYVLLEKVSDRVL